MKKPEFKIEVKDRSTSTGNYYNVYLYKDGKLVVCYPMKESILVVGDLLMKLEAFTKYYTEDND